MGRELALERKCTIHFSKPALTGEDQDRRLKEGKSMNEVRRGEKGGGAFLGDYPAGFDQAASSIKSNSFPARRFVSSMKILFR